MRKTYFHSGVTTPIVSIEMPCDDSFDSPGYSSGELVYRHIALNKTLPVGVGDVMSMTEEEIAKGIVFDECNVKVSNLEILSKRLAILRTRTGKKDATIDNSTIKDNDPVVKQDPASAPNVAE